MTQLTASLLLTQDAVFEVGQKQCCTLPPLLLPTAKPGLWGFLLGVFGGGQGTNIWNLLSPLLISLELYFGKGRRSLLPYRIPFCLPWVTTNWQVLIPLQCCFQLLQFTFPPDTTWGKIKYALREILRLKPMPTASFLGVWSEQQILLLRSQLYPRLPPAFSVSYRT